MTQPPPLLHVDMDACFVSVELVRRPEMRGLPVVVGGDGERGVVAAASYEARAYGVRSAMPSTRARRLCPGVVFLLGDHRHYSEVRRRVMLIFRRYTPLVEPLSLDEAFLDVSGVVRLHGPPTEVAAAIRSGVLAEEGLGCSVGIAANKFLAKMASAQAKPTAGTDGPAPGRGVQAVPADGIREFLDPLPVEAIWGVGPRTRERLQRLGVRTVAELRTVPESTLVSSFGRAAGAQFWHLARGIDERRVDPAQSVRSIGHEETFSRDLTEPGDLRRELIRMVDAVGRRLREAGVAGRTVTVKVRFPDFTTVSRSQTLPDATDLVVEILEVATGLMESLDTMSGIRLLGVSLSGLRDGSVRQLRFEDLGDPGWLEAEQAVDRIRDRFGVGSIGPATTVGPEGLRPRERGDGQWGPED